MKLQRVFLLIFFLLMMTKGLPQEQYKAKPDSEKGNNGNRKQVESGVYSFPEGEEDAVLIAGETTHFSEMELKVVRLTGLSEEIDLRNPEREQIFIVKEGEIKITVNNQTKTIGPNSVAVLLPNDKGSIQCVSPDATYYTMSYTSKKTVDFNRGKQEGGSFLIDFDELEYREHGKGGVRNYFRRATAMCPYYEMHVTNLNAGIKSHEPHTHSAAEMILMIDGNTEMEIGNEIHKAKKGDVYFIVSNVPHAIKNTGDKQCMYFAFQWE